MGFLWLVHPQQYQGTNRTRLPGPVRVGRPKAAPAVTAAREPRAVRAATPIFAPFATGGDGGAAAAGITGTTHGRRHRQLRDAGSAGTQEPAAPGPPVPRRDRLHRGIRRPSSTGDPGVQQTPAELPANPITGSRGRRPTGGPGGAVQEAEGIPAVRAGQAALAATSTSVRIRRRGRYRWPRCHQEPAGTGSAGGSAETALQGDAHTGVGGQKRVQAAPAAVGMAVPPKWTGGTPQPINTLSRSAAMAA